MLLGRGNFAENPDRHFFLEIFDVRSFRASSGMEVGRSGLPSVIRAVANGIALLSAVGGWEVGCSGPHWVTEVLIAFPFVLIRSVPVLSSGAGSFLQSGVFWFFSFRFYCLNAGA